MIPSEIPLTPWQTVSADLFYTQQSWFLIVVDYYSNFPFVRKLHNLTARVVVNETKMLFAENGIPKTLQCDNGTQFTSAEFQQLARQYGFEIVKSSPHYPRGHGFVERQVQTVKKTILKCRETGEDLAFLIGHVAAHFYALTDTTKETYDNLVRNLKTSLCPAVRQEKNFAQFEQRTLPPGEDLFVFL